MIINKPQKKTPNHSKERQNSYREAEKILKSYYKWHICAQRRLKKEWSQEDAKPLQRDKRWPLRDSKCLERELEKNDHKEAKMTLDYKHNVIMILEITLQLWKITIKRHKTTKNNGNEKLIKWLKTFISLVEWGEVEWGLFTGLTPVTCFLRNPPVAVLLYEYSEWRQCVVTQKEPICLNSV